MADPAKKRPQSRDVRWDIARGINDDGSAPNQIVMLALLTDIREELKRLNKTLTEASIFVNGKVG